ncbi:hypothetical protein Pelo_16237 [Pelomyxa schiedti]|nr:hypothetical protein Pelo_16237 [Pelomyxa schiedti]
MRYHCFPLSTKHSTVVQKLLFVSSVDHVAALPRPMHPHPLRFLLRREEYVPASDVPHNHDRVAVEPHIQNVSGHHVLPLAVVLHQIQQSQHPPLVWPHVPVVV